MQYNLLNDLLYENEFAPLACQYYLRRVYLISNLDNGKNAL